MAILFFNRPQKSKKQTQPDDPAEPQQATDDKPDFTDYIDFGEVEVEVDDNDFTPWEKFRENPDFEAFSWVGMDKLNRCLLQRKSCKPGQPTKNRHFLIKRNVMASCLALAVIEGLSSLEKYKQLIHRLDSLVPPTLNPAIDGKAPLTVTHEIYNRLQREKREKERKELEERKRRCADFWDKDVWKDEDCYLYFEGDAPVLICHGKRYTFGYEGHEPMTTIYGNGVSYLHYGFDVADECRGFLKNPQRKTSSITGRLYNAEQFCHLLFAATTFNCESISIDEAEKRMEEMEAQRSRSVQRKAYCRKENDNEERKKNCQLSTFPYPAKRPGECRFPDTTDSSNFQEYGEEEIKMHESDFHSWWFFYEDPDKPCMSHIGMDRQSRCILERRYVHGDLNHWTVEKRHFLIKRNVMASCLALAMIEDAMERNDYFEMIARLDRIVPQTGNPAIDGCQPLVPPKELLERKSKSEIEAEEKEKERQALNSKTVWQDKERKLYFEDSEPIMIYNGERYTFSCHPYEPMAIILRDGKAVSHIHNAFYPDECKSFIEKSNYLVGTITGKHHNAERFCRLLTTAIDNFYDCQIDEVEDKMQRELVKEKGIGQIQFETRDFKCEKVLYEGICLMLGHFENTLSKENHVDKIYCIAFGYPNRNSDYFEYYLLSEQEHHEFTKWPEKRQWKNKEEAFDWEHKNLEGKRQELCNEFSQNPAIYKPCFSLDELPSFSRPNNQKTDSSTLHIQYNRVSVCAADDYVNRSLEIKLPGDATVEELVNYIHHYYDGESYSAIPYTGGGNWWILESNKGILAEVNDDGKGVRYQMNPSTQLKRLGITTIDGTRSK